MQLCHTVFYEVAWDHPNASSVVEIQHVECPQVSFQSLLRVTPASVYFHLVKTPISEPSSFHVSGPLQGRSASQVSQLYNMQADALRLYATTANRTHNKQHRLSIWKTTMQVLIHSLLKTNKCYDVINNSKYWLCHLNALKILSVLQREAAMLARSWRL